MTLFYPDGPQCNHEGPYRREEEARGGRDVKGLERGRAPRQGVWATSRKWKGQELGSPLEPLEGAQPC